MQALTGDEFVLRAVRSEDLDRGSGQVEVIADLQRYGRNDVALETAVSRLSLEPSVSSVTWNVIEATVPRPRSPAPRPGPGQSTAEPGVKVP